MVEIVTSSGHLFVIDGDLTRLHCDAALVPVDRGLHATRTWRGLLGFSGRVRGVDLPAGWGDDVRCLLFRREPGEPEIWLGGIGRSNAPEAWYAEGVVDFVRRASAGHAPGRRLAVNVAGSGLGGSSHDKGRLFTTIVPALASAAAETGNDVVLVCWGEQQYAAAQRVRTRLRIADDVAAPSSDLTDKAVELAECARRSELVLFIGAGVSMGAGLRSWQGLLEALKDLAPNDTLNDPRFSELAVRDQANLIRRHFESPNAYQAAFSSLLAGSRYSLAHGLLASLRTREAVTTNYDGLFEMAASTAGRSCAVLPYEPVVQQDRWLLKLHGSVNHPGDLVLTRDDYLGLPARAGALFGVLQAMLLTRHMLFVGYSLTDDTFHKVMHEVRQARTGVPGKVGTALVLFDDPLLEELWGDDLDIVAMAPRPSTGRPTAGEISAAARRLDVFLDQIGLLAADVSSFLLDPTYESMLDDEERQLASAVRQVAVLAEAGDGPIAELLKPTVRRLGA